jgi:leucyl-tRNA synthetase
MWEQMGFDGQVCVQSWPEYDESKTIAASVEMAVQVSGKLRGTIQVALDSDQESVVAAAMANEKVARFLEGMEIMKVIHVPNKLVNLIAKPKK